ncbi:MAG: outer membrane beta-barrel protein [Campylobacterales bacterium]|nr:outer membrane beta-barrel protein [Campylobacterales bacterium]
MKRLLLIALLSSLSMAQTESVSITPVVGGTLNSDDTNLDNDYTYGLRLDFNRDVANSDLSANRVQLALDYSEGAYKGFGEANVLRMGANALWDFNKNAKVSPFIMAGFGYQAFEHGVINENEDGAFAAIGAGLEVKLDNSVNLVLEGKDIISTNQNNYFLGNVGIRYLMY